MKRIILDHLKRWWLVLAVILIAYFIFQTLSIHEKDSQTSNNPIIASVHDTLNNSIHSLFVFQSVMWLGFLLLWDFQRGLPRVLAVLPVTPKQIGRAWWVASVALPVISLGAIGSLAVVIFSNGMNPMVLLNGYLMDWILIVLYLGAVFGALTFMATTIPDTFTDRICAVLSGSFFALTVIGFMYFELMSLTLTQKLVIFSSFVILSILGWFRAEKMVLQRAGFRLVAKSPSKKTAQHKIPQGFGGLPYLAQRTFIQTTLIGFAIIIWMTLATSFLHASHSQNRAQMITSMIDGGSIPYVFVLLFFISPVVFQLRFLRTLPISPSVLAVTLVFLPVISIAAVGVIVTMLASFVAGEVIIQPAINGFLMLGAKAAGMVFLLVWRGLDATTYIFMFLIAVSGSLISLGMTLIFHLGTKAQEHPLWMYLTGFFLCVTVSFALTRRLLVKNSSTYRVRTMPTNAWSMARR